eukprot:TRINITY_DN82919_c0_g1_i1.p1 TRINITY_DN82919_c0_g1~~TRINITY_DN82919_c0_g1_i1.p1  ORF type:complete len:344 (-),score=92.32 TRINITY_DN82919_c0_g1_i1:147-1178(-)
MCKGQHAAPSSLCVFLRCGLGGQPLQLDDVDPHSHVADLKTLIAQQSLLAYQKRVPPRCQTLIIGTQVLEDGDRLEDYCGDDASSSISIDMIVSLEDIRSSLNAEGSACAKTGALQSLLELRATVDEDLLLEVAGLLEDRDPLVRQAAFDALQVVADRGNEVLIDALVGKLRNHSYFVQQAVLQGICAVSDDGNEKVIAAIEELAVSPRPDLQEDAIEALVRVAPRGDSRVVAALEKCLFDKDRVVRQTAIEALSEFVCIGEANMLDKLLSLLEDRDSQVRSAAVEALARLGDNDDDTFLARVRKLRDHAEDVHVQEAACELLSALFPAVRQAPLFCCSLNDL